MAQHQSQPHSPAEEKHGESHPESPLALVWKWGNFLILFGGLGWYLRKPLREFLDSRAKGIKEGLTNARQAKELALQKLSEIETRLAQLDQAIKELRQQASREAEEEKARILNDAKYESQKILDLARREIEGLKKSARLELKAYIAELAVKLAETQLHGSLGPEEDKRIINQFLQTLDEAKN